jgi:endonuclease-8
MPEGDTIFRSARTLQLALAGRVVTRFQTQLPKLARVDYDSAVVGRTIERVEAEGKWLKMFFSGDLVLLTHMLMSGSWHIYRIGERWKRPRIDMRIVIDTDEFQAVAFRVPVAEFHTGATLERHPSVRRLGPDILAPEFDEREALAQLRSRPDLEVGSALLAQSLMAGLGNIWKNETCFASRVNPFRTIGSLSIQELATIVKNARALLHASVTAYGRQRMAVYRRRGEACRVCGTAIESRKQGPECRTTFWCPVCQPETGHAGPAGDM